MNKIAILLLLLTSLYACSKKDRLDVDLNKINTAVNYHYFYQDFYDKSTSLNQLKQQYSILFPPQVKDSITNVLRTDTISIQSYQLAKQQFSNQQSLEENITKLLKRLNHHYPNLKQFQVYFSVGFFEDYTQPVLYNSQTGDIFIALDLFLGEDYKVYDAMRIPLYYQKNMNPNNLYPAIAKEIAEQLVTQNPRKLKFINQMLTEGKKMMFVDALLPTTSNHIKIGYTKQQLEWCQDNQANIWNHFVENQFLYSDSNQLVYQFLQPAPYSKFGTETEQESPGRTAVWVGWQICKKYWGNNPKISLKDLATELDDDKILKESKYKPL